MEDTVEFMTLRNTLCCMKRKVKEKSMLYITLDINSILVYRSTQSLDKYPSDTLESILFL